MERGRLGRAVGEWTDGPGEYCTTFYRHMCRSRGSFSNPRVPLGRGQTCPNWLMRGGLVGGQGPLKKSRVEENEPSGPSYPSPDASEDARSRRTVFLLAWGPEAGGSEALTMSCQNQSGRIGHGSVMRQLSLRFARRMMSCPSSTTVGSCRGCLRTVCSLFLTSSSLAFLGVSNQS